MNIGDSIRALVDTPGQTAGNWSILESNIGFVPENVANKATTMSGNTTSNILYLTAKAIYDWAIATFASLAGSISQTFSALTIELGHASDTTLSRSSAGVLAVEGVVIPSISSTNTLTNKRVTKRVVTITQSATPTINTDNGDIFQITGLGQAITSMSTNLSGSPNEGDMMMIQITDNGTARAITWGASFVS